jgi:predicted RNase H-like HicB family nuclease
MEISIAHSSSGQATTQTVQDSKVRAGEERCMQEQFRFKVLYQELHDGSYQAWVPALPACQATGTSLAQAQDRIQEAARCYCLTMLQHGAAVPQDSPCLPAMVDELQVSLGTANAM